MILIWRGWNEASLSVIVAFSPRTVPQAINELHDLLSLRATLRHDFEQIDVQINFVGFHLRLFGVQALFELFWRQPMRWIFVIHASLQDRLVCHIPTVPEMKKESGQLVLFPRRKRRDSLL
jgi:hypothetical protein